MSKSYPTIARYYDLISSKYDVATKGAFKWTPPEAAFKLLDSVIIDDGELLDLGIGTGQVAAFLHERSSRICGVDISSEMLKEVGRKFPSFELYQSNIEDGLPEIEGRKFDVISAIGVLEFLKDLSGSIATIKNFLKPTGYACFTVEEYIPGHALQGERESESWEGSGIPKAEVLEFLHYRRTANEVLELIKDSGLMTVSHHRLEAYLKSEKMIPVFYYIFLVKNC
jgi:predicted TPR repeat methyltransferase